MAEIHEITAAEIARLARVSRTTVSNWRRRHDDFPEPVGGTDTRPTFDRDEVEQWLEDGDRLPPTTPFESVWNRIRSMADGQEREELLADMLSVLLFRMEDMLGRHPDYPLTWSNLVDDEDSPGWLRGAMKETLVGSKQAEEDRVPEFFSGNQEGLIRLCREVGAMADSVGRARQLAEFLVAAYLHEHRGGHDDPPAPLARLMADLGGVDGTWRGWDADHSKSCVLDPACGVGGLLVAARDVGATRSLGQEERGHLARLAEARIDVAAAMPQDSTRTGSALSADAFAGQKFGVVLCKPPYGQKDWGVEQLAVDERWVYGTPPRAESELAWVQHCLAHAETGGRVVMLLPPAVASRGSGRRIRAELLRRGALRAVVALPPGAAQPAHVPLQLWVLEPPAAGAAPPTRMLMLDAAGGEGSAGGAIDWDQLSATVLEAWQEFADDPENITPEPARRRAVPVIELLDDEVDLTPARHLPDIDRRFQPEAVLRDAGAARDRLARALRAAEDALPGADWTARPSEEPWTVTTVGELVRSGAVTLVRASGAASGRAEDGDPASGGPPVLTLADVKADRAPSGVLPGEDAAAEPTRVAEGDVVLAGSLTGGRGGARARVAGAADEGAVLGRNLHLLRPDPEHVDPWFLAGFLGESANLRRAGTGSTVVRVDPRRLRLPLVGIAQQRAYGRAFRELHAFGNDLRRAVDLAEELTNSLADGLRAAALLPPSAWESGQEDEFGDDRDGWGGRVAALDT